MTRDNSTNIVPNGIPDGYHLIDRYELAPTASQNQKSFYRKAHVYTIRNGNGTTMTTLRSYDTDVMSVIDVTEDRQDSLGMPEGSINLYLSPYSYLFSVTTRKHIKAFANLTGPEYRELWDHSLNRDRYKVASISDLERVRSKRK